MSVFVRIFLRYLAGVLVAKGFLGDADGNMLATDPDVAALLEMSIGFAIGAASEAWYWLSKRVKKMDIPFTGGEV
jgi:hypothetical protein